MKKPQSIYQELLDSNDKLESSQMFGKPCGKYKGKAILSFYQDEIAFKLGRKEVPKLLEKYKGSKAFDPSGKGRPFKDWIQIPMDFEDQYQHLIQDAINYFDNS